MIRAEAIRRTRDRARAAIAERNSLSTWKVTRPGVGVEDPETGDWTPTVEVVWTGPGHFSDKSRPYVRSRADAALTIEEPTLCVGVDVPPLQIGDTVEAVEVDDPGLLDRSWTITGAPGSSYAIDRHYPLQEITAETAVELEGS